MKKYLGFLLVLLILICSGCESPKEEGQPKMMGVLEELSYFEGETYNPLDGITAYDKDNNDVTEFIKVIGYIPLVNGVLSEVGTFTYELCVVIDDEAIISQFVTLTVKEKPVYIVDKEKPVININATYLFMIGDKLDLNFNIQDNVDGDITGKAELKGLNNIPHDENQKLSSAGTYYLTVSVKDKAGNSASKTVCIIVKEQDKYNDIVRNEIISDEYKDINEQIVLEKYKLVWADEFNYTGKPNDKYWNYDIGNGSWGWGNNEKQYYTSDQKNVYVENGALRITAIKETINGYSYSSTRLKSNNKADFKYGYMEASIMLPGAGGAWPAFWMMPTKSVYGTWPASGEIDIMEYVANNENRYMGTVHNSKYHGGSAKSSGYKYGSELETKFHKYAIEWTPEFIKFYFDGELYHSYNNPNRFTDNHLEWPYDQDFYFILNVAVGGTLGGGIASDFTQTSMFVDYVRVYQTDYTGSDEIEPEAVEVSYQSTNNSIKLSWNKVNDNVGLYHYEIIVDGKQYAATNNLNYEITGLDSNKTYYIQVLAVDLANNCSTSGEIKISTKE